MVESDLEIFADFWSALNAIYDVDVTSDQIQSAFYALSVHELSLVQQEIKNYLAHDTTQRGPPTVHNLLHNCDYMLHKNKQDHS